MTDGNELLEARAAFDRHAWATAYALFRQAETHQPLVALDLDRLAISAYLSGHDSDGLDCWARAHHAFIREGLMRQAFQCAFWLGFLFLYRNESSRANGWLARGKRLIGDGPAERVEEGYLLFAEGYRLLWSGQLQEALPLFERAAAIATRFREQDLTGFSRLGVGVCRLQLGEIREGLLLIDEVMADTTAGEFSPLAIGIIYCAVLGSLQHSFDVMRARVWTAAFGEWCESQTEMVPFRGECLVHRVEVMRLEGSWPQALAEISAVDSITADYYLPWLGEAFYQQGEIHRLQGEFEQAEEAYRRATEQGFSLQPGFALMRLAQGRKDVAAASLSRMLAEAADPLWQARLLPAHVEVMIALGDLDAAEDSAARLREFAAVRDMPYLRALAAYATASVLLARGEAVGALQLLRSALECWHDLNNPYEAARTRTLISRACRLLGDAETAAVERDSARQLLQRLGAVADLASFDQEEVEGAVDRSGGLTEREIEVLRLVAAGKSNRTIAMELVLSEHTVRRHLQNAFAKIGVSSRAAATAYVFTHQLL